MKAVISLLLMCLIFCCANTFAQGSFSAFINTNIKASATAKQQVKVKSAKQAAELVKKRYGGKVLKVKPQRRNGKQSYKVKLIKKNGHISSVSVDAKSGKVKDKGKNKSKRKGN